MTGDYFLDFVLLVLLILAVVYLQEVLGIRLMFGIETAPLPDGHAFRICIGWKRYERKTPQGS